MSAWLNRTLITLPYEFAVCRSEKEFHRLLTTKKVPPGDWGCWILPGAGATAHFFMRPERIAIVSVGPVKGCTLAMINSLLCHEAVHIFQGCCAVMGEMDPSDEFMAYSIEAISQRLMEAYPKCR